MSNKLRKIFVDFDSVFGEEQINYQKEHEQKMEQIHKENMERRKSLNFIPKDGNSPLYFSEPFEGFVGDCESCSYYIDSNVGFVTGGWCKLHNGIGCGYGFTCKDNDSKYAIELEK